MQRKQPDAYPAKYRLMHKNGVIHQKRSSSCNRLLLLAVSQFPIVTSRGSVAETGVVKSKSNWPIGYRSIKSATTCGRNDTLKPSVAVSRTTPRGSFPA